MSFCLQRHLQQNHSSLEKIGVMYCDPSSVGWGEGMLCLSGFEDLAGGLGIPARVAADRGVGALTGALPLYVPEEVSSHD